ncbi:MAG: GIY-YIG nuclease family protein [Enterococcus sp.]
MLKEKAKKLPLLPGVYLMKNHFQQIIYVGKAKMLKNRVSSYFQKNSQHSKKVLQLIHQIDDFDFIIVDTELDALLLECSLIQRYHPFYNRQMNYFKNYNYIQFTDTGFQISDNPTKNSYGPFRSYKKIPAILAIIEETYQLPWLPEITRLSLEKQLPLLQTISFEQKKKEIQELFLGKNKKIIDYLKMRQEHFIAQLNFEKAGKIQAELELLIAFINRIDEQQAFLKQKEIHFALPLAADSNYVKHYFISYGQLIETTIAPSETEVLTFPTVGTDFLLHQTHLTKEQIDPIQILISYQKKLKKELER